MSIRDELAALLREHAMPSREADFPADEYECCADAILARFAVVELPEPDEAAANGAAGWDLPMWEVVTDAPDYVTGTSAGYWAATPGEVRAYAAALLAAAKRVEAKS